jgi:hypothetical protein
VEKEGNKDGQSDRKRKDEGAFKHDETVGKRRWVSEWTEGIARTRTWRTRSTEDSTTCDSKIYTAYRSRGEDSRSDSGK